MCCVVKKLNPSESNNKRKLAAIYLICNVKTLCCEKIGRNAQQRTLKFNTNKNAKRQNMDSVNQIVE